MYPFTSPAAYFMPGSDATAVGRPGLLAGIFRRQLKAYSFTRELSIAFFKYPGGMPWVLGPLSPPVPCILTGMGQNKKHLSRRFS